MLSLIPDPIKGYLMIGVAAAALVAGIWAYNSIYQRGYDAATVVAQVELQKRQDANDRAIATAEKVLREDLAEMKLQKDKLENEVAKLDAEAAADPDAGSYGIGPRSVQRLNAVR